MQRVVPIAPETEFLVRSITDAKLKARVQRDIAGAVAATDPDRAERIAQSITDKEQQGYALRWVAEAVAATDPDRAERIAQSITDPGIRAGTLLKIVNV